MFINSLDELFTLAGAHQVTLQEFLNRRTLIGGHWVEITYSHELRDSVISEVCESLGGRVKTQNKIANVLRRQNAPQHWGLKRVILESHSGKTKFRYCAGQDMPAECKEIRRFLVNLW